MTYVLERDGIAACPDDPLRVKPPEENPIYDRVHARIAKQEQADAIDQISLILTTGKGFLESYNSDGAKILFDAAELFDELTRNEESADLALIFGAALGAENGGKEKLETLIKGFAEGHAQCVADATTSQHMERDYE